MKSWSGCINCIEICINLSIQFFCPKYPHRTHPHTGCRAPFECPSASPLLWGWVQAAFKGTSFRQLESTVFLSLPKAHDDHLQAQLCLYHNNPALILLLASCSVFNHGGFFSNMVRVSPPSPPVPRDIILKLLHIICEALNWYSSLPH